MLPSSTIDETEVSEKKSNKAFEIDFENKKLGGIIDSREALKQAIHIALITQRYKYPVFSHSYGTDYDEAFDDGYMKAMGKVKNAVCDSLLCDDRISAVEDFEFERKVGKIAVSFRVVTNLGDIEMTEVIDNA